jgi:hypothetical protein
MNGADLEGGIASVRKLGWYAQDLRRHRERLHATRMTRKQGRRSRRGLVSSVGCLSAKAVAFCSGRLGWRVVTCCRLG